MPHFRITSLITVFLIILFSQTFAQWEAQDPGFPEGFAPIYSYVVDENSVWVAGGHEIDRTPYAGFSKTIDGGVTWHADTIEIEGLDNFRFTSIFAIDDSIAWVTMVDDVSDVLRGRVLKTIDGGNSWQHQSTAYPDDEVLSHVPTFVYFFDENNGFTAGYYGEYFTTSNGGNLWTIVATENIPSLLDDERPFNSNVWPLGGSTAWFGTSGGRVFKTTDRGNSWNAYDVGLGESTVFASFKDGLNGLAVTPIINRNIAKTTDGGKTWVTLANQLPVNALLIYIKGTKNTYMYGTGDLPTFIGSDPGSGFTADEGATFMFENDMPLDPLLSVNPTVGWAVSSTYDNNIYKWVGPNLDSLDVINAIENINVAHNPNSFHLSQNYPNPFNPETKINYKLTKNSNISLIIFDITGKEIRTLVRKNQVPGEYSINVNAGDLAGGIYIYTLKAGSFIQSRKMVLLK